MVSVLTTPLCRHHRPHLCPAADSVSIKFGCVGEDIETAEQSSPQIAGAEEVVDSAAEHLDGVVGRVSDITLGVYSEPRLALSTQHILKVQVPVNKGVWLVRAEFLHGRQCCLDDSTREGMGQLLGAFSDFVSPPLLGVLPESWETGWGWYGQASGKSPGLGYGFVNIIKISKGGLPGQLQDHGEVLVVPLMELHGAGSIPPGEGMGLVNEARVRVRDL